MKKQDKQRKKEFLDCLGNGKSIYECESEDELIDEIKLKEVLKK